MSKSKLNIPLMASLVAFAIAFALGCTGEQKANPALDQAVELARQGDQLLVAQDWNGYAALVHPEDMARFKSSLLLEFERLAMIRRTDSITVFDQAFSLEELRSDTPEKFFVDIMTIVFRISPDLNKSFTGMKNSFIGAVAENDSLIHVVVNSKMLLGTRHVDEMDINSVRKYDDEWKLRLSTKVQGIALMLQQSLQMQTK